MSEHEVPSPVERKLLTPGVFVLLALIGIGVCVAAYRFVFGLESVTNLDQQHPWGLWIAVDVATGVALAAGGFTTAALAHIFHREHYHAITRPALLTAMLGYTFVGIGLMADLGRYYNIWHPAWPTMWQGNSVLFEVGMCVMCYLTVLYIEFLPIVCERFIDNLRFPRLSRLCAAVNRVVDKTMFLFIIAGVVLSCLHQSSLGNLMVIAPSKVHPLWYTEIMALLFLLSAIAVGFPMVIFESIYASWALKLKPEMHILSALAKYIPFILGIYLAFKLGDLMIRESYVYIFEGSVQSVFFIIEMLFGLIVPFVMLLSPRVRNSPRLLFTAAFMVVLGVALNRVNVFLVSYQPPYAIKSYFPAIGEFAVTIGLVSLLILIYRLIVTYFPVISHPGTARAT
jgi:Ni/Fe-hydrogenase subunit HybB-like protein